MAKKKKPVKSNPVAKILRDPGARYRKRVEATTEEKAQKSDKWHRKAKYKGRSDLPLDYLCAAKYAYEAQAYSPPKAS